MKFNYDGEKLERFLQDNFYKILVGGLGMFMGLIYNSNRKQTKRIEEEYKTWLMYNRPGK